MSVPLIVIGDDANLFLNLTKDSAAFVIDAGAGDTVEAALVSVDHKTSVMATVAQSSTSTGADWPNSLIAIKFTAAQTAAVTVEGNALVAVQVTQGGEKETWFSLVKIVKGQIA